MNLGFFFGAGAEVGYGLPSGGKFAVDLFRQDPKPHKEKLRAELQAINKRSAYATEWLPSEYWTKSIHAFGQSDFGSLIESSIEYRKKSLIERLNDFDKEVDLAISDLKLDSESLRLKYKEQLGKAYGLETYGQEVKMNELLVKDVGLFRSQFYSALLDIVKISVPSSDTRRYAASFLQLLVGAHGQDLIQRLNQEVFTAAPDDIPIFDDVFGMFRLEFKRAGSVALDLLLREQKQYDAGETAPLEDLLCAISHKVLENIFSGVLDYQALIDSHFRYLYSPKTEWAKFTKMVIFLRATREYIVEVLGVDEMTNAGYYHDLLVCVAKNVEICAIGTANYNSIIESVAAKLDLAIPPVRHLNGGVQDYYNPYKNSVSSVDAPETAHSIDSGGTQGIENQIEVPFILTQSGLKPLTSVDMARRYVDLFDDFKKCDAVVVVGYSFSIDDNHINGLFRELVENSRKLIYWVVLEREGNEEQLRRELAKRLRVSVESGELLRVIPVTPTERMCGECLWIEKIVQAHIPSTPLPNSELET